MKNKRSALFQGHLVHTRRGDLANSFRYPICFLGIDLDELPSLTRELRLLSHNRRNIYALHDEDYADAQAHGLRGSVDTFLAANGSTTGAHRVHLVTQIRVVGYVFNPVSFFLCYDGDDRLSAVIAEVNNHFGGRHRYLLDERASVPCGRGDAFARDKRLFVSPFIHGPARYEFEVRSTDVAHDLRMRVARADEKPFFTAQLAGQRTELSDRSLARALVRYPLMTAQVSALIHWQAFRLWRMGGEYRRPEGYLPSPLVESVRRLAGPLLARVRRGHGLGGSTTSSGA